MDKVQWIILDRNEGEYGKFQGYYWQNVTNVTSYHFIELLSVCLQRGRIIASQDPFHVLYLQILRVCYG